MFDAILSIIQMIYHLPMVYYWLGTDAANALADASSGSMPRRFRGMSSSATHLADSDSVRAELATIGVSAATAWLPAPNAPKEGAAVAALPPRFTVLSYVPDARASFYDGPSLIGVAERTPEIRFLIVGGEGAWSQAAPPNVEFLGWRNDIDALYDASSVLVRTPLHDSVSCMTVEALAHGRAVVYSSGFPHTIQVAHGDSAGLERELRKLLSMSLDGRALVSSEAVEWARRMAEPSACYATIANELIGAAGR